VGKEISELKEQYKTKRRKLPYLTSLHEDIKLLEDFGFALKCPRAHMIYNWDEWYDKLKAFKEKHGHCNVPQLYKDEDGATVGNFVSKQRKNYARFCCGEKTGIINPDKIQKLEALGFVWKLRHGRPKKGDKAFRNKSIGIGYDNIDLNDASRNDNAEDMEFCDQILI
jgi:hypothetical protein